MNELLSDLQWRGLIHQSTDLDALGRHLSEGSRRLYAGFDPTSDSLTIGNLVALMLLRRFQLAGHRPVALMGGGTGLIGDPSGKQTERQLSSIEQIQANLRAQRPIFESLLELEGEARAQILDNAQWLVPLSYVEVLRDVGKHFSVNMMIQKESVKERLHNREQGISYTEFSYMILQAYDYLHLFEEHGVTIQIGGSDQWGNIVAGIDLVRRHTQSEVFALTSPLITKADGGKFGKTETGAVWLTRQRTSPYAFYQFWLNTADADLEKYLKIFTLLPREAIEALLAESAENPGARSGQRALAEHMTKLLHGESGLREARSATEALFSGEVAGLPQAALEEAFAGAPATQHERSQLHGEGLSLVELLPQTTLAKSKREAREFLSSGAVSVNGKRVDLEYAITSRDLLHGSLLLLRRGKKSWHLTRWV